MRKTWLLYVAIALTILGIILSTLRAVSLSFPIGFSDLPDEVPLLFIGLGILCMLMSARNVESKIAHEMKFGIRIQTASIIMAALTFSGLIIGMSLATPLDFEVEPEYISGILAASSILFGFWILFLEKILESQNMKTRVMRSGWVGLSISFSLLMTSAIFVYFSALKVVSSSFTLLVCTISFLENSTFVWLEIDNYLFHKASAQKTQQHG